MLTCHPPFSNPATCMEAVIIMSTVQCDLFCHVAYTGLAALCSLNTALL